MIGEADILQNWSQYQHYLQPNEPCYTSLPRAPMNRLQRYDQNVFSIKDLQREGTKKLSKMVGEYYNEGAMDLLR